MELGPDAVVLVFDPDRWAEAADDLGRILGRGREHELEGMEEARRCLAEPVLPGEYGRGPDVALQHAGPLDGRQRTVERLGDGRLEQALAKADPQLARQDLDDVLGGQRVASVEEFLEKARLRGGARGSLDRGICSGDLG